MSVQWLVAVAAAAPELASERVEGPLSERFPGGDGAALSLLLVGEHDGRVGPCGCSRVPRGGLLRLATAVRARRAADPTPDLLLHGGAWLSAVTVLGDDGAPLLSREAVEADARMHAALGRFPFDALNTTPRDLPGVPLGPHPGMVGANVDPDGQPVVPFKVFERGGVPVVVVGVSAPSTELLIGAWTDPVAALAAVPLPDEALVVVLAYGLSRRTTELAAVPGVDLVVDTASWTGVFEPIPAGDATIVRTPASGASLLEVRLWVEAGRPTRLVQRTSPLDASVPDDAFLASLAAAD